MNAYQEVTDKLIEALENGTVPWRKPWRTATVGFPTNLVSGKEYRGINVFVLSVLAREFGSRYWLTFNQAKKLKGSVRRGEKGTRVYFFSMLEKEINDKDSGEVVKKRIPMWRSYTVFNAEQCDGLQHPRLVQEMTGVKEAPVSAIEAGDAIVDGWSDCPAINYGGGSAFYRRSTDDITVPNRDRFETAEGYYSTLFHECVHATGHKDRLGRLGLSESAAFGDKVYSKEELVAEFGAAFLCARAGIEQDGTIENSAAYIDGWLKKLKSDVRVAIEAASQAQKAVDLIVE